MPADRFFREIAGVAEGGSGKVEAGHVGAAASEAECIEADMALQVQNPEAGNVADLRRLNREQHILAGEKALDPIGTGQVLDMDVGPLIPAGAIGIKERH